MAAASSSASFFRVREEDQLEIYHQQQQSSTLSSLAATGSQPPAAPPKKKRNLPGNPNPDAEVIALSPTTLMATNRFVCEVCNKGFQREQNLQLHRRGHNLPWKLKQKSTTSVARRKVYLCPEPSCVHHDPSRALGDLTGIKKHFCRKHGEKKYKCEKCSKKYAVQSDCKAHSKMCGTREYRCICSTVFSRRDSFVTHRAFCDALAQENAKLHAEINTAGLFANSNMSLGLSQANSQHSSLQEKGPSSCVDLLRLGASEVIGASHQFGPPSSSFFLAGTGSSSQYHFQEVEDPTKVPFNHEHLIQLHNLHSTNTAPSSTTSPTFFNLMNINEDSHNAGFFISDSMSLFGGNLAGGGGVPPLYSSSPALHSEPVLPQLSATALLQKAAQMGATAAGSGLSLLQGFAGSSKSSDNFGSERLMNSGQRLENEANLHDLMNSLANGNAGIFTGASSGIFNPGLGEMENIGRLERSLSIGGGLNSDGLTRDFLGVGSVVKGLGGEKEQQQLGSIDSELRTALSGGWPI